MNTTTKVTAAFDQLDNGFNHVLLSDLRKALPSMSRDDVDSAIFDLRMSRTLTLDAHDGRHVKLTREQIEAGIKEEGSWLVYAARR